MQSSTRLACYIMCLSPAYIESKAPDKPLQSDYQGTLTTLNNHEFPASHISIAGKKKCVPVYSAPCNADAVITCLSFNPKDKMLYLNLADVKEIEVPYPYATWEYKSPKCRGKDMYLLIKIIWNDAKRAATHYLIEPKRRMSAHIQKKAGTALSNIPFSGFRKLTVKRMPR